MVIQFHIFYLKKKEDISRTLIKCLHVSTLFNSFIFYQFIILCRTIGRESVKLD